MRRMVQYIFRRIGQMLIVLFAVSIIVFCVTNLTGDPVLLLCPPNATEEQIEMTREQSGLNLGYRQYGDRRLTASGA